MSEKLLEITERDEAGNITVTYVQSTANQDGMSRVDMIVCLYETGFIVEI